MPEKRKNNGKGLSPEIAADVEAFLKKVSSMEVYKSYDQVAYGICKVIWTFEPHENIGFYCHHIAIPQGQATRAQMVGAAIKVVYKLVALAKEEGVELPSGSGGISGFRREGGSETSRITLVRGGELKDDCSINYGFIVEADSKGYITVAADHIKGRDQFNKIKGMIEKLIDNTAVEELVTRPERTKDLVTRVVARTRIEYIDNIKAMGRK